MKRNKKLLPHLGIVVSLVLSALVGPLLAHSAVEAADPGCYVQSSAGVQKVDCPEEDDNGDTIDTSKCYYSTASSQGATGFRERDCGDESSSSGGGSATGDGNNCVGREPPFADNDPCKPATVNVEQGEYQCGRGPDAVSTAINLGCRGEDYPGTDPVNPIVDMAFAFMRLLSALVGLVIVGSIIWAGIQYSASRGNPQTTEAALKRITNTVIALLMYIFLFALANFLVPGGMLL
jgi:hypothetical protein